MAEGVLFTESSAQRIAKAVKRVEGMGVDTVGGKYGGRINEQTFFMRLTEEDSANPGKYKWTKVINSLGSWSSTSDTSGADYTAIEINGAKGLKADATNGTIALATFMGYDGGGKPVYLIDCGPAGCVVKITGNAAGGGKYTGRILYKTDSTAAASGNLALPEGISLPGADDALILHAPENGKPTHWLKTDSFAAGVIVGFNSAGKRIVVIDNGEARTASPNSLDDGSGTTAGVKSWDRNAVTSGDVYGDCPVTETYVTRTVWDGTAGELINYVKTRTIDASGHVVAISAETEVTIDTAEDCA